MTLGERIRNRRIELGLSQEELAKRCGYKYRSAINKIELGVNSLSLKKIEIMAAALETTVDYIAGLEEQPNTDYIVRLPDGESEVLIEKINSLDTISLSAAVKYIDYLLKQQEIDKDA